MATSPITYCSTLLKKIFIPDSLIKIEKNYVPVNVIVLTWLELFNNLFSDISKNTQYKYHNNLPIILKIYPSAIALAKQNRYTFYNN